MNEEQNNLRKAAILLAAMDANTADEMLEKLGPEQEQQMRMAIVDLGDVDPQEQRRVVDEFMRVGPMMPQGEPAGVDLTEQRGSRWSPPSLNDGERMPEPPRTFSAGSSGTSRPFRFLHEAETERLARVLTDERPQTIAVVLSHLPPEQAGEVLSRLTASLQVEVIHRLVDLEETDAEILREVEEALQPRFAEQMRKQRRRVAGFAAVDQILQASQPQVGMKVIDNLSTRDKALAERLAPPTVHVEFDDLTALDDNSLAMIFEKAGAELSMLALLGAAPELVERVLRWLPPTEAANVRYKLEHPEPVRLSDVESARRKIADIAERLHREKHIELQGSHETLGCELEAVI